MFYPHSHVPSLLSLFTYAISKMIKMCLNYIYLLPILVYIQGIFPNFNTTNILQHVTRSQSQYTITRYRQIYSFSYIRAERSNIKQPYTTDTYTGVYTYILPYTPSSYLKYLISRSPASPLQPRFEANTIILISYSTYLRATAIESARGKELNFAYLRRKN